MGWYPVSFRLFSKPLTSGASLVHGANDAFSSHSRASQLSVRVLRYRWLLDLLVLTSTGTYQWECQDPKMEVPTIYKAYIRPM